MNYEAGIFSRYLSDPQMAVIVSDEASIKRMLQFEITLAAAQATLGLIPLKAAAEIKEVLASVLITPGDLAAGTLQNGMPVVTLLEFAKKNLSADTKKHLHYGSTSQDVMDTAQALMFKEAIDLVESKIITLTQQLSKIIDKYGDVACMARTRGQQAIPVTFGTKVNSWSQPLQRQLQRLSEIRKRLLVVQLGGAAGTLSAFAEKASELREQLAKQLGLEPAAAWHTQRDNIGEFTNWLAMTTAILGKMGADVLVMAQSEVGEISENEEGGKSSAMPHKNNPVLSEALVAIAKINAGLQSQILLGMIHVNERDATAWILEWKAIPQMLIHAGTSLNHATTIATKMKVNREQMEKNVEQFLRK
jgi:3-carboxy-cis,cis-muconate cycloisomerase